MNKKENLKDLIKGIDKDTGDEGLRGYLDAIQDVKDLMENKIDDLTLNMNLIEQGKYRRKYKYRCLKKYEDKINVLNFILGD